MALKNSIKTSVIGLLLASRALAADVTEHTFLDGAAIRYTLPEGVTELTATPTTLSDVKYLLPFIGEISLSGKGTLAKEENGTYQLTLNPKIDAEANILNASNLLTWKFLKAGEKGNITLTVSDAGEHLKAEQFVFNQVYSQLAGELLEFNHEFTKTGEEDDYYSNKVNIVISNAMSTSLPAKDQIEPVINPFGAFKELSVVYSYISGKDYSDYKKNLDLKYHVKGHHNFQLNGTAIAGYPFAKVAGAENLPGYTVTVAAPVIDMSLKSEEEKKGVLATIQHNVKAYEDLLKQYNNPFADTIAASIQKHQDVLAKRTYDYFSNFTKADVGSFFLTFKFGTQNLNAPSDRSLSEIDVVIRKFNVKVLSDATESSQKMVLSMEHPQTSINELVGYIMTNATIVEPILVDLGYWDIVRNFANAEKLLSLLRQLSDDPKATGDAPLVITYIVNASGAKVGTISFEGATQAVMGWMLSIVPIK
jgi:hypothetical protein